MELHLDLNFWAWTLIGLNVLSLILMPLMFGKEREPYTYKSWLISALGFVLFLLALGIFG